MPKNYSLSVSFIFLSLFFFVFSCENEKFLDEINDSLRIVLIKMDFKFYNSKLISNCRIKNIEAKNQEKKCNKASKQKTSRYVIV
jgi:hypothetical protein